MLASYRLGDHLAGYTPNWRTFFGAAEWVAKETPTDAVITVRKPRLLHLLTGRYASKYVFSTDADVVLANVLESDYVVLDQVSGTTGRYLVPALERAPERFRIVFGTAAPPTLVLAVVELQEKAVGRPVASIADSRPIARLEP